MITLGRVVAVGISVSTFVFLFLHDSWRSDNLFLVPDLVLTAALLVAALLPDRIAVRAMTITLGFSAGVFATSVASYAVRDEFGAASLLGTAGCIVMAVLLTRRTTLDPAESREGSFSRAADPA
jgi:hypothetical protein